MFGYTGIYTQYLVRESSPVMDSRMASCRPAFWKWEKKCLGLKVWFPFSTTKWGHSCNIYKYIFLLWNFMRFGAGNFKARTFFSHFQNAGRQDATRESITGDDSLTEYCVLIYQSICTDIYYWAWIHFY